MRPVLADRPTTDTHTCKRPTQYVRRAPTERLVVTVRRHLERARPNPNLRDRPKGGRTGAGERQGRTVGRTLDNPDDRQANLGNGNKTRRLEPCQRCCGWHWADRAAAVSAQRVRLPDELSQPLPTSALRLSFSLPHLHRDRTFFQPHAERQTCRQNDISLRTSATATCCGVVTMTADFDGCGFRYS